MAYIITCGALFPSHCFTLLEIVFLVVVVPKQCLNLVAIWNVIPLCMCEGNAKGVLLIILYAFV